MGTATARTTATAGDPRRRSSRVGGENLLRLRLTDSLTGLRCRFGVAFLSRVSDGGHMSDRRSTVAVGGPVALETRGPEAAPITIEDLL
jgi:hypothetical protein